VSPNHSSTFSHRSFGKVTSTSSTEFCISGIPGVTVRAVFIGSRFGTGKLFLVGDEFLFEGLFEFHPLRLGSATGIAELVRTWISCSAILTSPFEFDVSERFPGHLSLGSLSLLWPDLEDRVSSSLNALTVGRISPFVKFCQAGIDISPIGSGAINLPLLVE
jgi:hypothetical protein